MNLSELTSEVSGARILGDPQLAIREVRDDSRLVTPGDLFVAIAGSAADGRRFLTDAVARGAAAVVIEDRAGHGDGGASAGKISDPFWEPLPEMDRWRDLGRSIVLVPDARHALARIAAKHWDSTAALTLIAVTGTNGKTTTTYLLEAILAAANLRTGVIGTIAYRVGSEGGGGAARGGGGAAVADRANGSTPDFSGFPRGFSHAAPLTTPGALALHALLAEMAAAGATDVVLEASSHALAQRRLDGCLFRVAGLSNVTQDHLDYHHSMEAYLDAKALLFEQRLDPGNGVAVLPMDRPEGRAMRGRLPPRQAVLGFATSATTNGSSVDVAVESSVSTAEGLRARLATPSGRLDLASTLVGDYNLANITLAVGMAIARGLPAEAIVRGIAAVRGVPGRLQSIANSRGVLTVVDYAHTPDALERAMGALRPLVAGSSGRLITVFGCGGDRDRGKRALMGEAAMRDSDLVVITSDNPRSEDPSAIIEAIVVGAERAGPRLGRAAALQTERRGFHVEPDRRRAVQAAIDASQAGDVVLIAGKGHEDYQIVGSTRLHFDDREEAARAFAGLPSGAGERA